MACPTRPSGLLVAARCIARVHTGVGGFFLLRGHAVRVDLAAIQAGLVTVVVSAVAHCNLPFLRRLCDELKSRDRIRRALAPRLDREWTVDFVRRFEDHQVERIRRAIIAYRSNRNVGDVTLAKELSRYLPKHSTNYSTLKNLQRLRKGERMRGATFLNACVQFLEVEMATPPEEELGLAMKRFVGNVFGYAALWTDVEGDYVLRVLGERTFDFPAALSQPDIPAKGIAVSGIRKQPEVGSVPVVLSISPGEGTDYGVARERYFLPRQDAPADEGAADAEANALSRKGVCLPVGGRDMLVMIRDFLFSHMYVLKREPFGFAGTMIVPPAYEFLATDVPQGMPPSQYDVVLHHVQREQSR